MEEPWSLLAATKSTYNQRFRRGDTGRILSHPSDYHSRWVDTLLFGETLIHATSPIRLDNERVIIITVCGMTMFPYLADGQWSREFRSKIQQQLKPLCERNAPWHRGAHYHALTILANPQQFEMGDWNQRLPAVHHLNDSQQKADPL